MPVRHEMCEWQHRPAIATQAIRVQFVIVLVQARDGAEVDHASTVGLVQAQGLSPRALLAPLQSTWLTT